MFNFGSNSRRNINFSTAGSSTANDLFSNVRAERLAREQKRKEELSAVIIQKVWRGYSGRRAVREDVMSRLESGKVESLEARAGLLMLLGSRLSISARKGQPAIEKREKDLLRDWIAAASIEDSKTKSLGAVAPIASSPEYPTILASICIRLLQVIADDPKTVQAAAFLTFLEGMLNPASYNGILDSTARTAKDDLVTILAQNGYVELLVQAMETLIASAQPKKKHPHHQPIIRLLTAPFSFAPEAASDMIPPIINYLLAVPALPTSIPIASLTHLSANLPIFSSILPYAAQHVEVLSQGRLSTELGKTYFLANLATFGITGDMLARNGSTGATNWIKVIGQVILDVREGWGKWIEGIKEDDDDEDVQMKGLDDEDSDEDDGPSSIGAKAAVTSGTAKSRIARPALPTNIANKVSLLALPAHLSALSNIVTSQSSNLSTSLVLGFSDLASALLSAFKGTPKWENILESLMLGEKSWPLVKRLWRECVRGKWSNSDDRREWEQLAENPARHPLIVLSLIYCHYLLITPDDEFFGEGQSNPFTLDEVLELSAIWRNLAFWGYMSGVSKPGEGIMGTEENRALFTRGVTRVSERNARRNFAPPEFWVMSSHMDIKSFVEAAVFEDAELSLPTEEEISRTNRATQRWTRRAIASISPRLGLLNNLPMAVPFDVRVEVFRQFVNSDRKRRHLSDYYDRRERRIKAKIRREKVAKDGFKYLADRGWKLKGEIKITFIDKFGEREQGIDGGGLYKEFLTLLCKEVFDAERGLWLVNAENQLYPNPHSYATEADNLKWYKFMGSMLGKALYDDILVDASFAGFFLARWLGRTSQLDDLNSLDKELYKGLIILKNYPNPEELALNFTIVEDEFGVQKTIELVPGGSDIAVTAENRHEYIQLMCKHKLGRQIAAQSHAFLEGLSVIVDPKWLRLFDQRELQQLIGGEETPIDIDDLKANTILHGHDKPEEVERLWKVIKSFSEDEKKALLRFVTSCSRPPLLGFKNLVPRFGIQLADTDVNRLPSASACFNLLKVPPYPSEEILRSKLLQAINSGAGFDLS